jgi:iron-sulfur cluster assembly accessory protein
METEITLTDKALLKLLQLRPDEQGVGFKFGVYGGGCSGYSYIFDFGFKQDFDDVEFEVNGLKVYIDQQSLPMVEGSTIDFNELSFEEPWVIENPNSRGGCGCGNSFQV